MVRSFDPASSFQLESDQPPPGRKHLSRWHANGVRLDLSLGIEQLAKRVAAERALNSAVSQYEGKEIAVHLVWGRSPSLRAQLPSEHSPWKDRTGGRSIGRADRRAEPKSVLPAGCGGMRSSARWTAEVVSLHFVPPPGDRSFMFGSASVSGFQFEDSVPGCPGLDATAVRRCFRGISRGGRIRIA